MCGAAAAKHVVTGVWPLVMCSAGAWLTRAYLPPWGFMCVMAIALYAGCKWLTYASARAAGVSTRPGRIAAYLLAWPGMDAQTFLSRDARAAVAPSIAEWIAAALKVAFGALVTWTMVPRALPEHPLLAGWLGMTGLICMVHFGTFHALSLMWRSVGTDAAPVMRSPLRSTSLAEFWGRRWNTAFHELAARFAFRPLRTEFGLAAATFATFVVSGLVHELVISVPAGGGYGLPTAYFVLQGVGITGERAPLGRRLGLGAGWRGWAFTMVMTAGPAYWLFAPPFVHVVALPLLAAIGAR